MSEELNSILERVRTLYLKYGIKSVTMDDVSRELGISKKTLYQYVADKNELVEKIADMEMNYHDTCLGNVSLENLNAVEELLKMHQVLNETLKVYSPTTEYDLKKYYPELYKRLISEKKRLMYEKVLANLRKGKQEGLYRPEMDEDVIARLQVARVNMLAENEMFTVEECLTPKFLYEIFIYHVRGIATAKGLKVLEENMHKILNNNQGN
jgi:TetR/AcrR family transcriptional regulator, cholesterol catabolism regulator